MLKLFHTKTLVGRISDYESIGMDMHGLIELTEDSKPYQEMFDRWTDPNRDHSLEPPFPTALLEDWFVETEHGERREIGLPGIFKRNDRLEILWRYF